MSVQAYSRAFCEPQYNQRLNVPDRPASLARRQELSERVRRELRSALDVPYGDSAQERLDIYPAAGERWARGTPGHWSQHDEQF